MSWANTSPPLSARYLIPSFDEQLQPYALSQLKDASFEKIGEDNYKLEYNIPESISGAETIKYTFEGSRSDLRAQNGKSRADCGEHIVVNPDLITHTDQDFSPSILCYVEYDSNLSNILEDKTEEFIQHINTRVDRDEALKRIHLRQDFIRDPVGFIGID